MFHIYVGSYTDDVTTLLFDPDTKTLISVATVTVGFHPSWLAFHPSDSSIVFAGLEQPEGEVATVKFDKDGQGTVLGKVKSGGHSPCALVVTPSEVLVGNVRVSRSSRRFGADLRVQSTWEAHLRRFRSRTTRQDSLETSCG